MWGLSVLERMHILKKKKELTLKMETSMDQYHATAAYLKDHKVVIWNVVLITFFQRFALFFVTWFVYKAFGLHGAHIYDVVMPVSYTHLDVYKRQVVFHECLLMHYILSGREPGACFLAQ